MRQPITFLSVQAVLALFLLACATQPSHLTISWQPVTRDVIGKPIHGVEYEVYVWVNDGPAVKHGPVTTTSIRIPLEVQSGDVIKASVESIHKGVRSGRSQAVSYVHPSE